MARMKKKLSRIEQVEALEQKAREYAMKAREIKEQELDEVQRPKLRKMVGHCFKFLNSYGGNDAKWWFYSRIVSFNEKNMTFVCAQFQYTSRQQIEIRERVEYNFQWRSAFGVEGGWIPISAAEYNRAKKNLLRAIDRILDGAELAKKKGWRG
jgi:hypothetical protein